MPDTLCTEQAVVGVDQSLDMSSVLLVDPCGEEAFRLIDLTGPGRSTVHVHVNFHIVLVLLDRRQVLDFLQAGIPGFSGGHTAVDGDGAAVRHGTATGGGMEDLADGAGAASQELGILIMVRIEFGIQHFYQALNLVGGTITVLV